jgi:hypothetical protein
MPQTIIQILNKGSESNRQDPCRKGNIINLPEKGSVVLTGDLHGHRRNFERIVAFSDLSNNPDRHLVLQEIIHGGQEDDKGGCVSYKLLIEAIKLKLEYPDRVHIIMGNHDTAVISEGSVMKDGREMNNAMRMALVREFNDASKAIIEALQKYLMSQALAVKCQNGIWISHSLIDDRNIDNFDTCIFEREITLADCSRNGQVYNFTWGRNQSQQLLDKLSEILNIRIFVLGHQTQKDGWLKAGKNAAIIISEHNHGCILPLELSKSYTLEEIVEKIVPLASIT